ETSGQTERSPSFLHLKDGGRPVCPQFIYGWSGDSAEPAAPAGECSGIARPISDKSEICAKSCKYSFSAIRMKAVSAATKIVKYQNIRRLPKGTAFVLRTSSKVGTLAATPTNFSALAIRAPSGAESIACRE